MANNPNWDELLGKVPEDIHGEITPLLQGWDDNFQSEIGKVHSEYEPYKFLKEGNVPAEDIQTAMGVLRAIQEDPEAVYTSLAESYGFGTKDDKSSEQGGTQTEDPNLANIPPEILAKMQALESGYSTMAEILLQQRQRDDEAAQDASLKQELAGLKAKHGAFDEEYVLSHMQLGSKAEEAIASYQQMVERIMVENNRPQPPRLLGSSGAGSIPGEGKIDVTKLNPSQTKQFVTDWLKGQQAQNQG